MTATSPSHAHHLPHAHPAVRGLLLVLPALFSLLTWVIIGSLFVIQQRGGDAGDVFAMVGLAVVTFVFSLGTFAIALMVLRRRSDHWVLVSLMTVSAVFSGFAAMTLPVLGLLFGGLAYYRHAVLQELSERVKFSASKVIRLGLGFSLTLILLAVAVQSLAAAAPFEGPEQLLDQTMNSAVLGVERVAPLVVPGFERNKVLDTYYQEQLDTGDAHMTIEQVRTNLSDYLRIPLTGRETMSEVIRLAIERRVKPAVIDYASYVFPLLIVSLFLLLKLLSPFLVWGILGVALILFRLFERFGIVRIGRRTVEAERLELT
ncbi:MAG: hypothetical protein HYZ09_04160 [Candidatus Kerfeldbacteria bacterium]|nr:hypothetical protein [Candidatus Kerfeldbacteria bacterium]